ncbi:leukocyte antigen CD37 isoform X2 [Pseudorasbora parva]|uniref:leukocyte antigen CD37 isoform X2 n=1 Tax=Pseudorasbora parva TaxID=51549 RepID=UPI00351E491F
MASECCLSLTKYFLFLFNLIFFLLGSLLLSLGLWVLFSETSIFRYIPISLFSYLLIASGSVTMSLGFLGCLGSLKTVKCLLAIYFILLTVLLAAQIVGGVIFYTQKTELVGKLNDHSLELIKSFGKNDSSLQDFKQILESIQKETKCCGWGGAEDWEGGIPCSCFYIANATANATLETQAPEFCDTCSSNHTCGIYKQGCKDNINKWLGENLTLILVVILAISVVEICGMILSMCLYKQGSVDYNTILK